MNNDNQEKLNALRTLADNTRQLIDAMMDFDAGIEEINEIGEVISELESAIRDCGGNRLLGHYDLASAKTDSNHTLPYSPVMGPYNPVAAPVNMCFDEETGTVIGNVNFGKAYEGPENMLHGSMISAVYDQLLALASACLGKPSYTAYLNITFKKPTPLYRDLVFTAWIDKEEGRKVTIKGHCELNGDILTEAEGLFINIQQEQ